MRLQVTIQLCFKKPGPNLETKQENSMLYLHLLAVMMTGGVLLEGVDSCLRNSPPVDQWGTERLFDLHLSADRDKISALTVVMRDYTFSCNGTISQWKLGWHLSMFRDDVCTITFTFFTLRPMAGDSCILSPVGSNSITVRPDRDYFSHMESIFNVSVEDRITVQAGDVVGLRVQSDRYCYGMRLWIAGTQFASTSNTIYYETFNENEESALPNIFDDINTCSSSYDSDEESPYITAVVEPVNKATNTMETNVQKGGKISEQTIESTVAIVTTATTATMYQSRVSGSVRMTRRVNFGDGRPAMAGTDDSGGNMVILTSVGASVGALLVVAAALTAVLCAWQCSRKRISQSVPENPPPYEVAENEAYGAQTQHFQQKQARNVSLAGAEKPHQFVMEENEAYQGLTHRPQDMGLNGYYDAAEHKEEKHDYVVDELFYDYVVNELVYELPS